MLTRKEKQVMATEGTPPIHERITRPLAAFFSDRTVWIPVVLAVVALSSLAVALIAVVEVTEMGHRLRSAENTIAALSERTDKLEAGWIDSSFPDVQPLGLGFSLVDFKVEPVDAGVRLTGSIINGSSLDHSDAVFTVILAANRQAKVTIPSLRAGHSAAFDVIVGPATERAVPKRIRVLYSGSTVSYY
jgi:hypothetical protein